MRPISHNTEPSPEQKPSWRPPAPKHGIFTALGRLILLAIILTLVILPFTPVAGRLKRGIQDIVHGKTTAREVTKEVIREVIKEVPRVEIRRVEVAPPPPALPDKLVTRKDVDVTTLFNGISINTTLQTSPGTYASLEVLDPAAYQVRFQVDIRLPRANQTVEELARINPSLPKILPGLPALLSTARVSGFYNQLYENKVKSVNRDLSHLNKLLDRHNFFDCETILELKHAESSRKVLMIQSEMDVVADGSDGDRSADLDDYISMSDYYQPFTSYAWKKQSATPNPLLARWNKKLADAKDEFSKKGLSSERNRQLKTTIDQLNLEIADFKSRSSLIADTDPFIVLSLLFRGYDSQNPYTPQIGDYAVVIHDKQVLPAICGDYGPSMKMGEASLFMAKQVNPKATPYRRPEDDLKVTYLVFPGTAKKPFSAPDLQEWRSTCIKYLNEIGGISNDYVVHDWTDVLKWKRDFVGPPWPIKIKLPAKSK